ncbi:MAG: hypothetical protein Q7U74_12220 [Saprospiraceae bacterium]|nr:hypothetical protein [Saprospiraceae bacterium]
MGRSPYGLDGELYNIWLYERSGLKEMQNLYGQYNLFALPSGQLAEDLKWIIDAATKETQLWSYSRINNLNAEANRRFKEKSEIVMMDD